MKHMLFTALFPSKMAKKLFFLSVLFSLTSFSIYGSTIYNCSTPAELRAAMAAVNPGDEIIVMPGVYEPSNKVRDAINKWVRFTSDQDGTASNPIILRGSSATNRPLLQCPDNDIYDGAVMSITGDYWQISNLEIAQGSKGLMLDTANHCTVTNIDVQDVGEEAIHIRSGSSYNTISQCTISNTGVNTAGFGEGIYIGSDRGQHNNFSPDCNFNVVENCTLGPNIRAEHFDIKEGTENNIVRNCILDGTGITGANFSDSFMDIKGIYTFIYNNTFHLNGNPNINSVIDFNNRTSSSYTYKTGFRNSFFNNTFELGTQTNIPTATSRGGVSTEIHFFSNTRIPDSTWNKTGNTAASTDAFEFCPTWNIVTCSTLGIEETDVIELELFPNPTSQELYVNVEDLEEIDIQIYDMNGKLLNDKIQVTATHIDVSQLSSGNYIIKMSVYGEKATGIFIKE